MSANFCETLFYRIWKWFGVEFIRRESLGGVSLPLAHPAEVGQALDIHYLAETWSKGTKTDPTCRRVYEDEFKRAVGEVFGCEPFIYTANSFDNGRLLEGLPNPRFVSPLANGLNSYRDIHNAAVFAHFNLSTDEVQFLRKVFGVKGREVYDTFNRQNYYQFVNRTSLRELPVPGTQVLPKKVLVMDKDMAFYIQGKFPGSRVHKFSSKEIEAIPVPVSGRPKVGSSPLSGADRTRNAKAKHKLVEAARKMKILEGKPEPQKSPRIGNETPLSREGQIEPGLFKDSKANVGKRNWLALIGSIYSKQVRTIHFDGVNDIVSWLRLKSHIRPASKTDNQLVNSTRFIEIDGKPRGRKLRDVIDSTCLWLDMDSPQNCCPYEFSRFFCGTEMVVYSSYSSARDWRRWRCIIPLSRPVNAKEYNAIAKDLLALSLEHGFAFDPSKKQPNDFLYLPCHGANDDAFLFEHFNDLARKPLDVDAWFAGSGSAKVEPGVVVEAGQRLAA